MDCFQSSLIGFDYLPGWVVQSMVGLTKLLVQDWLSPLVDIKSSVLIVFAEKNERSFCTECKSSSHFLAKNNRVFAYSMLQNLMSHYLRRQHSRIAQSVGHLTRKSEVLGWIPGLATHFRFSFCCFKRGSCQLLATVCARSTG